MLGINQSITTTLELDMPGPLLVQQLILKPSIGPLLKGIGLSETILTGAWYLWWERRQFTHGESLQPVHRSAMSIGVLATNYWRAKKKIMSKKEVWLCPKEGSIKINVDAAYDAELGKGCMGAIARDRKGKFMAASCKDIHFVADPFMAKAYTLRDGLSLAHFLGGNKIIIQSNNMQVIETMVNGCFSATSSSAIFDDCMNLSTGYRKILFEHCKREANQVAHDLARHCFINHDDDFWDNDPPSFIMRAMVNDVTVL
jgi:hypothetical protein